MWKVVHVLARMLPRVRNSGRNVMNESELLLRKSTDRNWVYCESLCVHPNVARQEIGF